MIERAFAWADSNKKSRVSPVHGEPEAFLLLSDGFEINVTDVEENEQEGNIQVEEPRVIKPHNITWLKFKKLPTIFIYFLSTQNMFCIDSCFPGPSWVPFSIPTSRTSMLRMMPCCRVSLAVEPRDPQAKQLPALGLEMLLVLWASSFLNVPNSHWIFLGVVLWWYLIVF